MVRTFGLALVAIELLAGTAAAAPAHRHHSSYHPAHLHQLAGTLTPDSAAQASRELELRQKTDEAAVTHQFELSSLQERRDYTDQARKYGQHNLETLKLQNWLTIWITAMMIAIIVVAMGLTALQLAVEFKTDSLTSTLKVTKDGIEMSSSVVGFFVLLAALFVFYFYLKQVYKIDHLQTGSAAVDQDDHVEGTAPAEASSATPPTQPVGQTTPSNVGAPQ